MSSPNEPPPPNPILTMYEGFVQNTPLVTRYTLTTISISWIVSFFVNPTYALANIPLFTVFKFEIYRIPLSPLVCNNILSLIFAFISFLDHGKRLEFSMGSTAFAWMLFTLAFYSNMVFLILCLFVYAITGDEGFLYLNSYGIWIILLALIAIECCKAPRGSQRHLFFIVVPTIYYPLALFAIFSLIGGFHLAYFLAIGVGYAHGFGYFDRFKVSDSRLKQWEDTTLVNFTRREGWVVGQAATGSDAWNNMGSGGGRGGFSLFSPQGRQPQDGGASTGGGGGPAPVQAPQEPAQPAGFPKSSGRALGGTSRRPTAADARAARLEAIERRAAEEAEENA